VNEARTAARSCEQKRARFQLLYETGRLCGYRAATIEAPESSDRSLLAVEQAEAHLAACPYCKEVRASCTRKRATAGGAVTAALAGVAAVCWAWLRRTAGSGSVTAKATAAVIAAAVVTGGAVQTRGGHKVPYNTSRPQPVGAAPAAPRALPVVTVPFRSKTSHVGARPVVSRGIVPPRLTAPPGTRLSPTVTRNVTPHRGVRSNVSAAEREFGLER